MSDIFFLDLRDVLGVLDVFGKFYVFCEMSDVFLDV